MDEGETLRAVEGMALSLPRGPQRGRSGNRRSSAVGASVEIQDWRAYQPGDDVRSVDWNAVARTGELIVRLREDEVSPRVEVVLDGSRSMALTPGKEARAREVALLLCELAARQGLAPRLMVLAARPERGEGSDCRRLASRCPLDATDDLGSALRRAPPLGRCGLRLVVSDFLFEAARAGALGALTQGTAALGLVQVLAAQDIRPEGGFGARLVDCESGEALEHLLTPGLVQRYLRRLEEHQGLLRAAAHRARALLLQASAEVSIAELARGGLFPLVCPAHAEAPWPSR